MPVYHHFEQLDSTNAYLQRQQAVTDIRGWVVSADLQTAGKGMGSNGWESEAKQNLTFSLALDLHFLAAEHQFLLSEAVALGVVKALDGLLPAEKLSIKWPNDIFYDGHKLGGILINSTIKANSMDISIIGIGLNVNQMRFHPWPSRPISMRQITGKTYALQPLLEQVVESIYNKVEILKSSPAAIEQDYLQRLFRYHTWADYEVAGKAVRLFMTGIDPFGRLMLTDDAGNEQIFDIKEIKFLL